MAAILSFWPSKGSITTYGTEAPPDNILDWISSLEYWSVLKIYFFIQIQKMQKEMMQMITIAKDRPKWSILTTNYSFLQQIIHSYNKSTLKSSDLVTLVLFQIHIFILVRSSWIEHVGPEH